MLLGHPVRLEVVQRAPRRAGVGADRSRLHADGGWRSIVATALEL